MRLTSIVLTIAILGIPGSLEAAKPARKAAVSAVHKVRRGETAAKIARISGLSLEALAELNPKVNLSKLAPGNLLRVKGSPAQAKRTAETSLTESSADDSATSSIPSVPVTPLPVIPANGPAVLVHLERLIPTNMNVGVPVSAKKSSHTVPFLTSQDLVPVFPMSSGLEYESRVANELGFEPADPNQLDLLWPVQTRSISSAWGPRMRTKTVRVVKANKKRRVRVRYQGSHKGVDLTAPIGTDVYAAQDGKVIVSERHPQYGNYIVLDHGNGVQTAYAHHRMNLATLGDIVRRGQKIAEVGVTGRTTGPHLHFELRLQGQHQNPLAVLNDVEEIPAEMLALNEMIKGPRR